MDDREVIVRIPVPGQVPSGPVELILHRGSPLLWGFCSLSGSILRLAEILRRGLPRLRVVVEEAVGVPPHVRRDVEERYGDLQRQTLEATGDLPVLVIEGTVRTIAVEADEQSQRPNPLKTLVGKYR